MNFLSKLFMISTLAWSLAVFAGSKGDNTFDGAPALIVDQQAPDLSQNLDVTSGACRTFGVNAICLLHTAQGYDARVFLKDFRSESTITVMNYLITRTNAQKPIKVEVQRMSDATNWEKNVAVVTRISKSEMPTKAEIDTVKLLVGPKKTGQFIFSEVK